mmetsp:Transcript_131369/g.380037  ORF Transcript_131369/g.380037 Transcript_131369/m.380037 type:complete len:215 (+) Transcript_131369:269-913(+)
MPVTMPRRIAMHPVTANNFQTFVVNISMSIAVFSHPARRSDRRPFLLMLVSLLPKASSAWSAGCSEALLLMLPIAHVSSVVLWAWSIMSASLPKQRQGQIFLAAFAGFKNAKRTGSRTNMKNVAKRKGANTTRRKIIVAPIATAATMIDATLLMCVYFNCCSCCCSACKISVTLAVTSRWIRAAMSSRSSEVKGCNTATGRIAPEPPSAKLQSG